MTDTAKTPWHIWAVGALTLLWNSAGIFSYMSTKLGKLEALELPADQIAYMESFPAWANAFWALGVWGAFLGSILILLRSRWAVTSILVAMIGLVVTTYYQRVLTTLPDGMEGLGLPIAIWVITLFMLFYASRMKRQGILR